MKSRIIVILILVWLIIPFTACRNNIEYAPELVAYIEDNSPKYINCCCSEIDDSALTGDRILIQFEGVTSIEDVNCIIESYNSFIRENSNYFDNESTVEIAFHFGKLHSYKNRFATATNRYDDMVLNELYIGNPFIDYQIKDFSGMFNDIEVLHIGYLNSIDREDIELLDEMASLQDVYIQDSELIDNTYLQGLINDINPSIGIHYL